MTYQTTPKHEMIRGIVFFLMLGGFGIAMSYWKQAPTQAAQVDPYTLPPPELYFPVNARDNLHSGRPGVTLRDEMAMRALQGLLAAQESGGRYLDGPLAYDCVVDKAYGIADRMLMIRQCAIDKERTAKAERDRNYEAERRRREAEASENKKESK